MSLDRKEVAVKLAAADFANPSDPLIKGKEAEWAARMVMYADALLSALVPVAPASGAPTTLPGAPLAAPSPAATPAAWVPSVGDVVKQMGETDEVATSNGIRVVVSTNPIRWVYVRNGARMGGCFEPKGWGNEVAFVRPATSSERAAAGLPVDESATKPVDRGALLDAMRAAFREWRRTPEDTRDTEVVATDAAIAFMAKGGAS